MKASFWINVLKYVLGFGLLAVIIFRYWEAKPGKPTDDQKALSLVAGAAVDVQAQRANETPGLRQTFTERDIKVWPFALACALWVVCLYITFLRWYVLVRAQDLPFTVRNAMRLGLVSYFFNSILPGSVGGDVIKAVAVAREQSRRTVAVATVLIDRVIGLWALAWLVALAGGIFWAIEDPHLMGNEALKMIVRLTAGLVFTSAVIWSLMGLFSPARSEAIAVRLHRLPKVGGPVAELWRAGWLYRRKKKAVALALIMTLGGHLGWVVIFHLCVSAFPDPQQDAKPEHGPASFPQHLLIVPVGMTAQALFPLPGGVGGGEAAYGWLYTLVGHAAAVGILGCLVQRVIAWGIGLIGYVIYLRMPKEEVVQARRAADQMAATPQPAVP
ncbi:MAG TPA: lysylphosphatidylglycerol synthase transmembrane domain-containing protein [Gemmataceae bacterium]|nr:lysylphosphatidylglycerol synthase transmembrane domain-containing protein [Gemmataceae bacterium]